MRNYLLTLTVCGLLTSVFPASALCEDAAQEGAGALAAANNAFALDVYRQIGAVQGNIFFSPFSITAALGMTAEGARGRTAEQMKKTMHLDLLSDTERHAAYRSYFSQVNGSDGQKPYTLSIANDLWCQKEYSFRKDFLAAIKENYYGAAQTLDFKNAPDASRLTINKAIEEKTMAKIKDLLPAGSITDSTRLVLTNAIYFKGDWEREFKKASTAEQPFYLPGGGSAKVKTMHQTGRFGYTETDRMQMLKMGYKGGDLSMVVLLPKRRDGLKELEDSLTAAEFGRWLALLNAGRTAEVAVSFPKFKAAHTFSVKNTLMALGMTDAFAPLRLADFSGIVSNGDYLYIADVFHKAVCEVDEKGTVAAAATAVVCPGNGCARTLEFKADHPFMYLIVDDRSNTILFAGRMENPNRD